MKWISLAFVLTLIVSDSAYGQQPAALAGVVVDETDAVLPRARVTASMLPGELSFAQF